MRESTTLPSSEEAQVQALHRLLQHETAVLVGPTGERVDLPPGIHAILRRVVEHLEQGRPITLLPEDQQITTQQAANILGMSRPHLIKLLESGTLPYCKTGSHRRLYVRDVLAFAGKRDQERHAALNALAREAFEDGLYDVTSMPVGGDDE